MSISFRSYTSGDLLCVTLHSNAGLISFYTFVTLQFVLNRTRMKNQIENLSFYIN